MSGERTRGLLLQATSYHQTVRQSWTWVDGWWEDEREGFADSLHVAYSAEYPVLAEAPPSFYGPRMSEPAFVEAVKQAGTIKAEFQQRSSENAQIYED